MTLIAGHMYHMYKLIVPRRPLWDCFQLETVHMGYYINLIGTDWLSYFVQVDKSSYKNSRSARLLRCQF